MEVTYKEKQQASTSKLGRLLKNYSILALILTIVSALGFIGFLFYYVVLILLGVASFGLFALSPEYVAMWQAGETLSKIVMGLFAASPFIALVGIVLSAIAIILCKRSPGDARCRGAIIFCIVNIVLLSIYAGLLFIGILG